MSSDEDGADGPTPPAKPEEIKQGWAELDGTQAAPDAPWPVNDDGSIPDRFVKEKGLLLDAITLGPTPAARKEFQIWTYDFKVIDGDKPTVCPKTDRPISNEWLLTILQMLRQRGFVKPNQTIHWVGRQAKLENLCTCFAEGRTPIEAAKTKKRSRGRPADTDLVEDRRVWDAWKSGYYKTQQALARELGDGWTAKKVKVVIDRQRKRLERQKSVSTSDK